MNKRLFAIVLVLVVSACERQSHFFEGGACDGDRHRPGEPAPSGPSSVGGIVGHFIDGGVASGGSGGTVSGTSSEGDGGAGGGDTGSGGSGGSGGATTVASTGYCSTDTMCGAGLVCDQTSGACAVARGGCGTASFQPTRTAGEVALLVDRSNSMHDSTATGTRWSDLVGSLDHVLAERSDVAWGLGLFPVSDAQACLTAPLAITPAMGSAPAISAAIHGATPTGSGTPTRQALSEAGKQLLGSGRPTRKYVLLATDGEPNCLPGARDPEILDVEGTVQEIRALAQQGAGTIVLGVGTGNAEAAALTAMAQAGGHARMTGAAYYTANDAPALESALAEVARQIALCTFDLSPPPPAGTTLTLSIGGQAFARNLTHVGDGWDVTAAGRAIELYGAACAAIQSGAAIQIGYGCGTGTRCDATAMACVAAGVP